MLDAVDRETRNWYDDRGISIAIDAEKNDELRVPKVCVALSGGGMRSAAVSIGALQAFHRYGILQQSAVLSAVSGGGYSLGWLYSQLHEKESRPFWNALSAGSDRVASIRPKLVPPEIVMSSPLAAISGILRSGGSRMERQFSDHYLSPGNATAIYAGAIENAFGYPPRWRAREPSVPSGGSIRTVRFPPTSLAAFKDRLTELRLPYPVLTATALKVKALPTDDRDLPVFYSPTYLAEAAFEITPGQVGSLSLGYSDEPLTFLTLSNAVAISGSAPDDLKDPSALLRGDFQVGATANFRAAPILNRGDETIWRQMPLLSTLVLADGGNIDNLGLFALIRRQCRQIFVVDAEHDPVATFESYQLLRHRLRTEHHVEIAIPELDDYLLRDSECSPQAGGLITALPVCIRVPRGDCGDLSRKTNKRRHEQYPEQCFRARALPHTVFEGKVDGLPVSSLDGTSSAKTPVLSVVYFKLGLVRNRPALPRALSGGAFPHDTTWNVNLGPERFEAYRQLGFELVAQHFHGGAK